MGEIENTQLMREIIRRMAWQRAKGELESVLETFAGEENGSGELLFLRVEALIGDFNNNMQELLY